MCGVTYAEKLASFNYITIHWCAKNGCLLPPFATIPSKGFYMIIHPLNNLNTSFYNLFFFKDIWKKDIPVYDSFIDTRVGKLYYDHTISSNSFLFDLSCILNTYLCSQIKDKENIVQIELFIHPSSKILTIKYVWKMSFKSFQWDMHSNFSQNDSIHVEIGFLEPVSNTDEKTKYIWKKNSIDNFDVFEPFMTFLSNDFLENSTVYSEILSPMGFHTKIRSKIVIYKSPKDDCSLYILYYLPKSVFVDKYQLEDLIQFNIEAPVWKLQKWGSIILIETVLDHLNTSFFVDLPIHLRYFPPKKDMFYTSNLPFPITFFSCKPIQGMI
ncbi:hypothetical protein PMAC_000155 [Pneumocystis sp. 'macacae']|nr:hypothetical protein PMAC_000155 [Pneumocystis sp. 'macacae']